MRIFFLGTTSFSEKLFRHLIENGVEIDTVFTTTPEFKISYSKEKNVRNFNYSDMQAVAQEYGVNCITLDAANGEKLQDHKSYFLERQPDLILVMGWYYMVTKELRSLAKYGAFGIHASMLPDYAGGAPLVWAMINGEKIAGVSLFKLEDGVDDGDILEQASFEIENQDTILEVYNKATEASKDILLRCIKNFDQIVYKPQNKQLIKVFPQRKPEDGEINLNWESTKLYNFIRAQSFPYPGAFIRTVDGKKIIIEKCRIAD